jgi:hypothetical protein
MPVVEPGSKRHAYYVSKYATKSTDQRGDVPWKTDVLNDRTGEVRRLRTSARYRNWSSSHGWECRMVDIRRAAAVVGDRRRRAALLMLSESTSATGPAALPPAPSTADPP